MSETGRVSSCYYCSQTLDLPNPECPKAHLHARRQVPCHACLNRDTSHPSGLCAPCRAVTTPARVLPTTERHGAYNGWCRVAGIPVKAKDCPECVKADAETAPARTPREDQ